MNWRTTLIAGAMALVSLATTQTTPGGSTTPAPATGTVPTVATAVTFTPEVRKAVMDSISDVVMKRAFVPGIDFSKWTEFVGKRQTEIDAATTPVMFATRINATLRDFGFSHIRLQAPSATDPAGSIVGIGITAQIVEEGIQIISVKPGSPAFRAGLKQDEIITKIDGVKPTATGQIRGELGQVRTFEIKGTDGKVREVKITLQRIQTQIAFWQEAPPALPPATPPATPPARPAPQRDNLTWPSADVAVLRIVSFSGNFTREQIKGFVGEAKRGTKLVIDLRNNGGGAADNMGYLLSLLMPPRTEYGVFVSRSLANRYKEANPEAPITAEAIAKWTPEANRLRTRPVRDFEPYTGKIAVLINRGSGSASEITAASLREQRGAVLVGSRSAGAVLASVFANIPGGFRLQYPISDYVTSKYVRLEGNPIKPDVEVANPFSSDGKDPVLEAAIAALAK